MADIATIWNVDQAVGDWALSPSSWPIWVDEQGNSIHDERGRVVGNDFIPGDGLVSGQDLYTAVLISLFSDAEAAPDDVIPDGSGDPRGWWGGTIGSKLWLRARSKATPTLLALVKADIAQALQWLIDDDVVAAIDVTTEFTRPSMLGARIILRRRDGARAALSFSRLWETV